MTVDASVTPDAETLVIQYLTSAFAGAGVLVASDMPTGYGTGTDPISPLVWINTLVGNKVAKAWQGRTILWMSTLDYDTFDTEHDGNNARWNAKELGRQVVTAVMAMPNYRLVPYGQVTRAEVYTASPRPDWNAKVRRYGGTIEIWARAAVAEGS